MKTRRPNASVALRSVDIEVEISNDSPLLRVPKKKIERAIRLTAATHGKSRGNVSVVLLGDAAMRRLNKQYLEHDYTTDVVTFALDDTTLDGEIYISSHAAQRQSKEFNVSLTNEILRLVIHGVLHLLGFDDATTALRQRMHEEENFILQKM